MAPTKDTEPALQIKHIALFEPNCERHSLSFPDWLGNKDLTRMFAREHFVPMQADYITSFEAAETLQYTVQHTRRLVREGKLDGLKLGRDWIINQSSVREYLLRKSNLSLRFANE